MANQSVSCECTRHILYNLIEIQIGSAGPGREQILRAQLVLTGNRLERNHLLNRTEYVATIEMDLTRMGCKNGIWMEIHQVRIQ
jgi:hypothetical protein